METPTTYNTVLLWIELWGPSTKSIKITKVDVSELLGSYCNIFKGVRPVLEGLVVTMHEDACETGSQIPRALDVLFAQARVHCDNKPRQIVLNHDYNMTFSISWMVVFSAWNTIIELEARAVSRATPIVTSRGTP